jgi:hypothetical protein
MEERVDKKVRSYREDIRRFQKNRDFEELERTLIEITEYHKVNIEADKIAKKMQLEIIQIQVVFSNYRRWKKQENEA